LAVHQAHVAALALVGGEPSSTVMVPTVDRETSPAASTDVPSREVDETGDHMAVEAAESEVVPDCIPAGTSNRSSPPSIYLIPKDLQRYNLKNEFAAGLVGRSISALCQNTYLFHLLRSSR
jgi:hypothetical protein